LRALHTPPFGLPENPIRKAFAGVSIHIGFALPFGFVKDQMGFGLVLAVMGYLLV